MAATTWTSLRRRTRLIPRMLATVDGVVAASVASAASAYASAAAWRSPRASARVALATSRVSR
jgi:hypothetical protein